MATGCDKQEIDGGVSLPGGTRLDGKMKGYRLGDMVMALAFVFAFVVKPIWDEYRGGAKSQIDVKKIEQEHAAIMESNHRLERAMAEAVYVLTLDEAERKQLRLQMPDSLRERSDRRAR